tara:strand:+ start:123 stop:776 length:654 start_codon:yes stop_codon:yes gene_type:complete
MAPSTQEIVNGILAASTRNDNNNGETFTISRESLVTLMENIDPPKRPPSSFILYKTQNKEKLLEMYTDITRSADLSKRMVEHYNNLEPSDKLPYEEQYATLKAEYDKKMEEHLKCFPKEKKKRGRPRKNSEEKNTKQKGRFSEPKIIESDSDSDYQEKSQNESNSKSQPAKFVEITDSESATAYLVNLTTCIYYDVDAPWGSPIGRYSESDKVFTPY